jgi:hypothetical protein
VLREEVIASRAPLASLINSTDMGEQTLQFLSKLNAINEITSDGDGASILTEEEQVAASKITEVEQEQGLVKFITPFLQRCLPEPVHGDPCPPKLINSEHFQWLVHPYVPAANFLRLKPDLFLSFDPFVAYGSGQQPRQGSGDGFLFGSLAGYPLQRAGCVKALFEAKRGSLEKSDIGELAGYHKCIEDDCYGMLFGSNDFLLYHSWNGYPLSMRRGKWTQPGSLQAVRAHFSAIPESPLLRLMRNLSRDLKAPFCQVTRADGRRSSYLGSGASGHVFAVGDPLKPKALKAILTGSHTRVSMEYERLMSAATTCPEAVVPPIQGSLREFDEGGGFLLQHVGTPFSLDSPSRCREAFAKLAELHCSGLLHGDPRLPNLVVVKGAPMWIDLPASTLCGVDQRRDATLLARSILEMRSIFIEDLPSEVITALEQYVARSARSVEALADAVWNSRLKN